MDTINNEMRERIENHNKLFQTLSEELSQLPKGGLSKKTIKGHIYYYHVIGNKQKIIKDEQIIQDLKRRKFIVKCMKRLKENIKNYTDFLEGYRPFDSTEILNGLPLAYEGVPIDYVCKVFPNVDWFHKSYETNPHYPEQIIHTTSIGLKVRSKSEILIVDKLVQNEIPFRYEALLELGGMSLYPDFTILSPKDNTIYYWEHFGMINNQKYNEKKDKKLALMYKYDIRPWSNLITTYDGPDGSFSSLDVQRIISCYFK